MKYFRTLPSMPKTKVFGLAGDSLKEETNAGITARLPLVTSEFAPVVIDQTVVPTKAKITTMAVIADAKWPNPRAEPRRFGIRVEEIFKAGCRIIISINNKSVPVQTLPRLPWPEICN